MSNYKIRVNSEAESKEVQELFSEFGLNMNDWSEFALPKYISNFIDGEFSDYSIYDSGINDWKEITLPDLRDLVVLKRNSIEDATHKGSITDNVYYVSSDEEVYRFESSAWCFSTVIVADLKPIEKPMKEYLIKSGDGKYLLTRHGSIGAIEIPDGAEIYIDLGFGNHSFYKDNFKLCWCGVRWENTVHNSVNLEHWNNTPVLWKRANQPEELPFIDDEPLQSLNDQYAEIEKVRQSAWQKQEGGSHYKNLKIQPMQYALENKLDYAQANVVKYVTRHKEKNGKEDLLKAIHNLELMIEFYYGDEK